MPDIELIIGFEAVAFIGAVAFFVWKKLGGWPEAHYRIWGIPWFRQVIFEEDGTPSSWILKTDRIHHSIPSFKNARGEWLIDPANDSRYHGRPSRYWNRGDARQIPIKTWTQPENRWDPELIKAAYDDDSIERARTIGHRLPFPVFWVFAAAVVAIVVAGIAAYYSHDTYCALKPAMC
ncbi:hypothetical protein AUG19_02285 [archaeon 13_1_20CM_2_54_9]|nr:MAG: hypothetical protein AUJ07_03905 [Crenarchaeota archaeon 13_1_40CM_3_53_5]OLE76675.1 MAG: hypothetical protein AUG19_02285 [archaeon 13_1_20CM_2_54_9]